MRTGGAILKRFDLVVVGSGPAGCSAAIHALNERPDWSIALVDRLGPEQHRRYHRMCGEGISHAGLKELDFDPKAFIVTEIDKAVEHWPGDIDVVTKLHGSIIDRPALLGAIREDFERRGGTLVHGSVEDAVQDGPTLQAIMDGGDVLETKWLIACDGASSKIRRRFFDNEPQEVVWADQYILPGKIDEHTIEFFYDERYAGGYMWKFPDGSGHRMGFPKGTYPAPSGALEVHRRAIPLGEAPNLVRGNVALAGDAAGQVNPVTFGGIRLAFAAGRMASDGALKGDMGIYEKRWKSSHYADPIFWKVFQVMRRMNNEELKDAMWPYRNGYTALNHASALIGNRRHRDLYRAFSLTIKYGW